VPSLVSSARQDLMSTIHGSIAYGTESDQMYPFLAVSSLKQASEHKIIISALMHGRSGPKTS
jgi:uncharacterized protein (UPF0303 family)